jgi:hypothetical protein
MGKKKNRVQKSGMSRRGFLVGGVRNSLGLYLSSGVLGNWIGQAVADNVRINSVPTLIFDLKGGLALIGNFLVGGRGGPLDLLTSYDQMGWDPRLDTKALDHSFGLPMATYSSSILRGLRQAATEVPEALKNFAMASLCHFSQDDNDENVMSAVSLIANTDVRFPLALGTLNTPTGSGGNSRAVKGKDFSALTINSVEDLVGAKQFQGELNQLSKKSQRDLLMTTARLSGLQAARWPTKEQLAQIDQVIAKSFQDLLGAVSENVDPRKNPIFQKIYGIDENTLPTAVTAKRATIVMNVLKKNTGPGTIMIEECDVHAYNGGNAENKDLEVGIEIGRAVVAAHLLRTPLFIQILSDGGVYSAPPDPKRPFDRIWKGDAGDKSLTVMGYFHPDGPKTSKRVQLGHYTNDQSADLRTVIGNSPEKVGYAVFANYLNICGRLSEFPEKHRGIFTEDELNDLIVFG